MGKIERLIPLLVCEDIPAAHDFLVEAFGFTSGGIHRNPEGKAVHAEVRAGARRYRRPLCGTGVDLGGAIQILSCANGGLVVYVEDVDAHYERARVRGEGSGGASVVVCHSVEVAM